jgi:hypothetical protein
MAAKSGNKAVVYITSAPSVSAVDLPCTGDAGRTIYTVNDIAKRFWDKAVAVIVETSPDGTTWTPFPTGFTVQYCGGKIIFASARTAGTQVRVDVNYYPVSQLAEAKEWSLDIEVEMLDGTKFGDTWKTNYAGQRSASGSVSQWWVDNFFLANITNPLVAVLYIEDGQPQRYEAFIKLTSDGVNAAVDNLIEEEINFDTDGEVYYVAS